LECAKSHLPETLTFGRSPNFLIFLELHMRQLNFELKQICMHNKDGSFSTRANREWILTLIANQLHELGFKKLKATGLKPKHIITLVKKWIDEDLSAGTIKNRMSHLRWWAQKIGKSSIIAKNNDFYGIERRIYVTNLSKAQTLNKEILNQICNQYIIYSLRLQSEFGLRRAESIKFNVLFADRGDHLHLKGSWCKGGRARDIPIRNDSQRNLLNEIRFFVGSNSLIPVNLMYVEQLRIYEYATVKVGLHKLHGLRHQFAQDRYKELTGRLAPSAGGKTSKELTAEEKSQDHETRLIISCELGHEREQVTAVYLGR
jgi:hypothetical protein